MRIEFPLREIKTQYGVSVDPTIALPVKTIEGYHLFRFLIDSGADFSIMPHAVAPRLGVTLDPTREMTIVGIEGCGIKAWLSEITIKVGESDFQLPCLFSSNENTPYLLGRLEFFQRFKITFDSRAKRIVIED